MPPLSPRLKGASVVVPVGPQAPRAATFRWQRRRLPRLKADGRGREAFGPAAKGAPRTRPDWIVLGVLGHSAERVRSRSRADAAAEMPRAPDHLQQLPVSSAAAGCRSASASAERAVAFQAAEASLGGGKSDTGELVPAPERARPALPIGQLHPRSVFGTPASSSPPSSVCSTLELAGAAARPDRVPHSTRLQGSAVRRSAEPA